MLVYITLISAILTAYLYNKPEEKRSMPQWYEDAKLGLFFHYGPYSVPGFAPQFDPTGKLGTDEYFLNNPYAEWYLNTMQIEGSPTQKHHIATYGQNYSYDNFVPIFEAESRKWNPQEWVDLFKASGARYGVLTSKHHDGICLWKTPRDIVGDFVSALKREQITPGVYYSSGYDWKHNPQHNPIRTSNDGITAMERSETYAQYVASHWYELIDRYQPQILWSDIAFPRKKELNEVMDHYHRIQPNGVVNDRWGCSFLDVAIDYMSKSTGEKNPLRLLAGHNSWFRSFYRRFVQDHSADFETVEYEEESDYFPKKWEFTRGSGFTFGYNREDEDPKKQSHLLTLSGFLNDVVNVVSKNGNYLFAVTPRANGSIPVYQKELLEGFGHWNRLNEEAIFNSRPYLMGIAKTDSENVQVRLTRSNDQISIYIFLLSYSHETTVVIHDFPEPKPKAVATLLPNHPVQYSWDSGVLTLHVDINSEYPLVVKIAPQ